MSMICAAGNHVKFMICAAADFLDNEVSFAMVSMTADS